MGHEKPKKGKSAGSAVSERRGRGRPRIIPEAERRRRLIDAAELVFVEAGYDAARMDDVARRAGMSKKTLYEVFDTKEALLTALIADRTNTLMAEIEADSGDRPPREVLITFLRQVAQFILSPRNMEMDRLVMVEARRSPPLARVFYREGPGRAIAALVRWFNIQRARGTLIIDDPEEVAGMLLGMTVSELHMEAMLGATRPPTKTMIERRIARAVDIFLKGTHAVPGTAAPAAPEPALR